MPDIFIYVHEQWRVADVFDTPRQRHESQCQHKMSPPTPAAFFVAAMPSMMFHVSFSPLADAAMHVMFATLMMRMPPCHCFQMLATTPRYAVASEPCY